MNKFNTGNLPLPLIISIVFSLTFLTGPLPARCNDRKDSARQHIQLLDQKHAKGRLSDSIYLNAVHRSLQAFTSEDILFSNKETLELLSSYRKVIESNPEYARYKRQYYGLLSNQAQMAGRDGEMLYYAKKINDLETAASSQPSVTALTITAGYYNGTNAYQHTRSLFEKNKSFLLHLPGQLTAGEPDVVKTVQSVILLNHICEGLYSLGDSIDGMQVEAAVHKIAQFATEKFPSDNEALAYIAYAKAMILHNRGKGLQILPAQQSAYRELETLLADETTPEHLQHYIRFALTEWKLAYYLKIKNTDSTARYLAAFLDTYKKESLAYNLYNIYKYKARASYNLGRYKESADTLQAAIKVLDSSRTAITRDINDMMYARAESEERQILLDESKVQRQRSDRQLSFVLGGSGILLLSGIGLTLYFRSRQKAKFLEFKLNMARNIHDETSPALLYAKTLAKSTRIAAEKGELEAHIEHTMGIIRSLAHDLKSDRQYTLYDLQSTITESLQKLSSGGDFSYSIRFDANKKHFISHYQFSQIRAILNECITNTIKHAEFNAIDLSFSQTNKKLTITYRDNGKGWEIKAGSGIGIKNMEERGKMLNGDLEISNKFPEGYTIRLTVLLR